MVAEIELLDCKKNDFNASFVPTEYDASIMIINKLRKFLAKILSTHTSLNGNELVDNVE